MSVVAFLAGVVGPGVAAEAAKTALRELTDGDDKKAPVEDEEDEEQEKVKEDEEVAAAAEGEKKDEEDEKMDEDAPKDAEASATAPSADQEGVSSKKATPDPTTEPKDSDMAVDGDAAAKEDAPTRSVPHSKVARAASLALKSSAKAARALADAEDAQVRGTLATLIKLTLTKLELKMSQFEELEEVLEEERRALESSRASLANERVNLRKMLEHVRTELAKQQANGGTMSPGLGSAVGEAQAALTASATKINPVSGDATMEGDSGPVASGAIAQLS